MTPAEQKHCICQDQHRRGYCTEPECPYYVTMPVLTPRKALWEYSDDEIAREYYVRAQRKLGDPRIGVSFPTTHQQEALAALTDGAKP